MCVRDHPDTWHLYTFGIYQEASIYATSTGGQRPSGWTTDEEITVKLLKKIFATPPSGKFGTFAGVFTPSILTILGVIMYLRFAWVVGHAGIAGALIMVIVAHLLVVPTALAVSSIATNRTVRTGGNYFILSRSLGLEMGGAIGIGLYFAQALSVTLYALGFTEALINVFAGLPKIPVAIVTILAVAGLAFWNTSLALKSQYIILVLIGLSLISIFTGTGQNPPDKIALWARTVDGKEALPFGTVFAVFFPAVTGFTQGVSMSGDLEDPKKSIPRGTMAAVALGFVIYLALMIWLGVHADSAELRNIHTITLKKISRIGLLVVLGIWGATLSSAMGSVLGAPRILQALAADGVVPRFLARGHGPTNMPRVATLITLAIALMGLSLAFASPSGLNAVASVITMFFLATYGMTCLASCLAEWSHTPSYRPTFRVPPIITLLGGIGCFYMMSLINLLAMLAAMIIIAFVYFGLQRKNMRKTWGDMRHGIWAALIRRGLLVLRESHYHPINWQPNILVLGGSPKARSHLLDLGAWIGGDRGMVTYCFLISGDYAGLGERRNKLQTSLEESITKAHPNIFAKVHVCKDIFPGALNFAQAYGVSGFEPNTVLMGWTQDPKNRESYTDVIRGLTQLDKCILLLHHDEEKGFGDRQNIDIWWGGLQNNGGLMLLLTTMLTEQGPWRGAKVKVKMIVSENAPLSTTRRNLEQIIKDARIKAEAQIFSRSPPDRPIPDIITENSNADLVLLGLRPPDEKESGTQFTSRVSRLLEGVGTALLVKSSTDFRGAEMLFETDWE
jgi:amino acid transporter